MPEEYTERDDADDVLDVFASGRNDVDVARVVQSRPPREETKNLGVEQRGEKHAR